MVKCWLWRAGARRLSMPKAEAAGLAPKQAADAQDPSGLLVRGFCVAALSDPALLRGENVSHGSQEVQCEA